LKSLVVIAPDEEFAGVKLFALLLLGVVVLFAVLLLIVVLFAVTLVFNAVLFPVLLLLFVLFATALLGTMLLVVVLFVVLLLAVVTVFVVNKTGVNSRFTQNQNNIMAVNKLSDTSTKDGRDYFNISGIKFIELNDNELAKLNVLKTDSGYSVNTEELYNFNKKFVPDEDIPKGQLRTDYDNDVRYRIHRKMKKYGYPDEKIILIKENNNLTLNSFHINTVNYTNWKHDNFSKLCPVAIISTFFKGQYISCRWYVTNGYSPLIKGTSAFSEMSEYGTSLHEKTPVSKLPGLSKLIPIKLKIGNPNIKINYIQQAFSGNNTIILPKTNKNRGVLFNRDLMNYEDYRNMKETYSEYVLWFVPTEEFINALPERYSTQLRKELKLVEKVESGEISKDDLCEEMKGEQSYLGLCDLQSGSLDEAMVYPNPATEHTTLKFKINNERSLTIGLYEPTGRLIRLLYENKYYSTGIYDENINLSDLPAGVYILGIYSNKKEQVSVRVIKQ